MILRDPWPTDFAQVIEEKILSMYKVEPLVSLDSTTYRISA